MPPIEGFMFDLDGTLILSDRSLGSYRVLPGATEVLETLDEKDIPFVVLTNGTAYPPAEQASKLRNAGLPVEDDQMLTPSSVAADLMVRNGEHSALLLGTPGVGHCLKEAGIEILLHGDDSADKADAVYVGWHPGCGMKDIETACNAILNGARLYVASNVPFFASTSGRTMGYSFAITAAIRAVTKAPMILTGKPSLEALRFVARKLRVPMKRVGVVGDDPLVEIIMARRGGAQSFGVTTGFNKEADWRAQHERRRPDRLLSGVSDLLEFL
jgi:HAD superfamily hydrolase (TIGR01450 family)